MQSKPPQSNHHQQVLLFQHDRLNNFGNPVHLVVPNTTIYLYFPTPCMNYGHTIFLFSAFLLVMTTMLVIHKLFCLVFFHLKKDRNHAIMIVLYIIMIETKIQIFQRDQQKDMKCEALKRLKEALTEMAMPSFVHSTHQHKHIYYTQ